MKTLVDGRTQPQRQSRMEIAALARANLAVLAVVMTSLRMFGSEATLEAILVMAFVLPSYNSLGIIKPMTTVYLACHLA